VKSLIPLEMNTRDLSSILNLSRDKWMKILRSSNSYYRNRLMLTRKHKPLRKQNRKKQNKRRSLKMEARWVRVKTDMSPQEKLLAPKDLLRPNKRDRP